MEKKANENGFEGIVAIQLSTRFWPGQVKLRPEDLGLDPAKMPPEEVFFLGNKKLYPKARRDQFNHLISKARNFLNDNSYPFVMDYVRAIPKRNLTKVIERLEELKAEFFTVRDEFLADYDYIRADWKELVEKKWPGLWEKLAPHYPPKDYLTRKFDFYWTIFDIRGAEVSPASAPELIEAYNQARANLQERYEEMVEEAVVYLRKKVLDTVQNLATRLKEGKIVRNDTLESVRKVETWFKDLNIFGDQKVEDSLRQLRAAVNGTDYEGLKDNEPLKAELAKLADQVAAHAANLSDVSNITGGYKRKINLS